jgi:hypothetical protein
MKKKIEGLTKKASLINIKEDDEFEKLINDISNIPTSCGDISDVGNIIGMFVGLDSDKIIEFKRGYIHGKSNSMEIHDEVINKEKTITDLEEE